MPRPHLLFALVALLASCRKSAPARFCDQDLSGVWVNASDRHFAYRFRDHDQIIRGEYLRRSDDGGLDKPDEPILFELHRTPEAIAGVMRAVGPAPNGRVCPIEFGMKVTTCQANAMQAQVETEIPITNECRRLIFEDGGEAPSTIVEFRFEKAGDHPSGGGEPPKAH